MSAKRCSPRVARRGRVARGPRPDPSNLPAVSDLRDRGERADTRVSSGSGRATGRWAPLALLALLPPLIVPLPVSATPVATIVAPPAAGSLATRQLTADECVAIALHRSAKIAEARGAVARYKAQLAEVEALYGPRLSATGWLAPMFTVEGTALDRDVTRRWKKLSDWGPYLHLDALLALPLYSFGRIEAGVDAARARADVERARLRAVRHVVAVEVRRLYILRLYALSLQPTLRAADRLIGEVLSQAQKQYDAGTGAVSQVDLSKLTYAQTVVERYRRQAIDGARLAEAGLKLTMGLKRGERVQFAEHRLARTLPTLAPLDELIKQAARQRPEWTQLRKGLRATRSLAQAERLANAPVVVLAGQLSADWAPTRQDTPNPYHLDTYNNLGGGIALVLRWDLNPLKARARTALATARGAEVAALKQYADSGIPTDVFRARQTAAQQCELSTVARRGVKATTRWMAFAAIAFKAGTGEASDVVEGLVASLQAKQAWYAHLRDCHVAHADLRRAVGRDD